MDVYEDTMIEVFKIHRVRKKVPVCFGTNFVKYWPIFIFFYGQT